MQTFLILSLLSSPWCDVQVTVRGVWVLDWAGKPVEPTPWRRGLQTSGLTVKDGRLISVGDQKSNFTGHLLPIRPPGKESATSTRLLSRPVPIVPDPAVSQRAVLEKYLRKPNPDLEGLAADPFRPDVFYAVVEMDGPFLLEIRWPKGAEKALIKRIVEVKVPEIEPWRYDPNYRFEGVTVTAPGPELVIAYERASDELPRLLAVKWKDKSAQSLTAAVLPVPFAKLEPRAGKDSLLNVNGLAAVYPRKRSATGGAPTAGNRRSSSPDESEPQARYLLLAARDEERIIVLDARSYRILRVVDVDFRGPGGERLKWVSPEGIAVDSRLNRVYVISDPDSIHGNYRRRENREAEGNYASMVPLLFTLKLSDILPPK